MITPREGLRARDVKYTMRVARRRFASERKAGTSHGLTFKPWARRTYNAPACHGKLARIVGGK